MVQKLNLLEHICGFFLSLGLQSWGWHLLTRNLGASKDVCEVSGGHLVTCRSSILLLDVAVLSLLLQGSPMLSGVVDFLMPKKVVGPDLWGSHNHGGCGVTDGHVEGCLGFEV